MSPYFYCELICFFVVAILVFGLAYREEKMDRKERYFLVPLIVCLLSLLIDLINYWLPIDGGFYDLTIALDFLAFLFQDILIASFAAFVSVTLEENGKKNAVAKIVAVICLLDIAFLSVAFALGKLFYYESNVYQTGPWMLFSYIGPLLSLLVCLSCAVVYRRSFTPREHVAAMIYGSFPIFFAIVLPIFGIYDSSFIISSITLLLVYVILQSTVVDKGKMREKLFREFSEKDILTGLYNRRGFDERVSLLVKGAAVGVAYSDINGLKYTNDNFGHQAGDDLILNYSELLKKKFSSLDIYRISGDEFVIICENMNEEQFADRIAVFERELAGHGELASIGSAFGAWDESRSLIRSAESEMYKKKKRYYTVHAEKSR